MNLTLVVIVIVVIIAAALFAGIAAKAAGKESTGKAEVYYLKKSLFSPAERSFLGVLEAINYDGVTIASKVRLADIFGVNSGLERGERQRALNRISAKHVDFLLLQKSDGCPLLGIELDDISHEEERRAARDQWVDAVFSSAGLPILHVPAKSAYDPREVHRQIDAALVGKETDARVAPAQAVAHH